MKFNPWPYQEHAIEHMLENPAAGLFMEMGLGKTAPCLTAADLLINDYLEVNKILVVAPKRIADSVWTDEAEKWDHLKHLRFSKIMGDDADRKAALKRKADIYLINREMVAWLVGYFGTGWPFDMLIIDESSSFKNPDSRRFKALRMVRPKIKRVVILTGTPAPNTLLDLWAQIYLLDRGERLGEKFTDYRKKYFSEGKRNGHVVYSYSEKKPEKEIRDVLGADIYQKEIFEKISTLCISMKTADYLNLPERIERVVPIHLGEKAMDAYVEFERDQVLQLENEEEITAVNAAALTSKLLQFANGAVYDENKNFHEMHMAKIEALEEIVDVANGQPVLVFYNFIHDWIRIEQHLKKYHPVQLKGDAEYKAWNQGKIQLLCAHPASAGHGLNMQAGGNIVVWFGPTWNLEHDQQANARLHRQGQKNAVIIHRLVATGTMDPDVLVALQNKTAGQDALMDAVKARIRKYSNQLV